jgi:transcriptional regulator with XRE-family HTH domain
MRKDKMKNGNTVHQDLESALSRCRREPRWEEATEERWQRLYAATGGPLMAWLLDEAAARDLSLSELACTLGVTVGYMAQLHSGLRGTEDISREFAWACGVFLRVPAVVVLIVAGSLKLVDCVAATEFERWVEDEYVEPEPVALKCGATVGVKELQLLPRLVREVGKAAAIHEVRVREL